jgi:hypothetical protein
MRGCESVFKVVDFSLMFEPRREGRGEPLKRWVEGEVFDRRYRRFRGETNWPSHTM